MSSRVERDKGEAMAQSAPEGRIIRRILRVNHAGEHGAVSIYSTQIAWARKHAPDILAWLEETIGHEQDIPSRKIIGADSKRDVDTKHPPLRAVRE